MDNFFSRMRTNARALDRGEKLAPGLSLMFEDPADLLEVITPARLRLLEAIGNKTVSLFALATSLARDPSAVRRDVTLLESKHLVRTRKIPNPGYGMQTVVEKGCRNNCADGDRIAGRIAWAGSLLASLCYM